jgi:hypothetical protein
VRKVLLRVFVPNNATDDRRGKRSQDPHLRLRSILTDPDAPTGEVALWLQIVGSKTRRQLLDKDHFTPRHNFRIAQKRYAIAKQAKRI